MQGDGAVGAALVGGAVQMVAMTGSSATGRKIMGACAPDLKRLVLELGGKDPMVVFADADLGQAAKDAVDNSLMNCGQVCCSVERIYVEEVRRRAWWGAAVRGCVGVCAVQWCVCVEVRCVVCVCVVLRGKRVSERGS